VEYLSYGLARCEGRSEPLHFIVRRMGSQTLPVHSCRLGVGRWLALRFGVEIKHMGLFCGVRRSNTRDFSVTKL